ncbi:MAG: HD domain-containing protein [bacterium]
MHSVVSRLEPVYQKIYERAKPFLRTRKNVIHTKIALQYALKLLKEETGDNKIVIPGILLHDVGWKTVPEPLQLTAFGPNASNPGLVRVHELEGAKIARNILEQLHYSPKRVKEICDIVRGHDSRKRPLSRNDRFVKDSDKLFRYSRKGMSIDSDRFQITKMTYIRYLEKKIDQWFFLPTSRRLAREELARRKKEKQTK